MNPLTNKLCSAQVPPVSVLLATALVSIRNCGGSPVHLRAMLHSGTNQFYHQ